MHLHSLKSTYTRLKPLGKDLSKDFDAFYLKGLLVVSCVLLKGPSYNCMHPLWINLPLESNVNVIHKLLRDRFNQDNLNIGALPDEVQTVYTQALLAHARIPWTKLTVMTLDYVSKNAKENETRKLARTAKTWLTNSVETLDVPFALELAIIAHSSHAKKA